MTRIYHNPRCSKSRQTLALLKEHGVEPEVTEYLKNPPNRDELKQLLTQLGLSPRQLLRSKEAEYKLAGLDDNSLNDEQVIDAMLEYPKLIERPIVVHKGRAAIGRPPQNILEIL
ncbi:MAG: arsenate reductase (glutaredoxin) [Pseudomonadota bacterium]